MCKRSSCSILPWNCQCFYFNILIGEKWYLIVALICVSLMAKDETYSHVLICYLYLLFSKVSVQFLYSFSNNIVCFLFFLFLILINFFSAVLDLCCCVGFSLSVMSRGYFLVMVRGLLIATVLLVERRLWGTQASVAVACGLSSCVSQALEHRLCRCDARARVHT